MDEDERKDENIVKGIKGVSKHLGIAGAVRTLNWDVFDQSFDYMPRLGASNHCPLDFPNRYIFYYPELLHRYQS